VRRRGNRNGRWSRLIVGGDEAYHRATFPLVVVVLGCGVAGLTCAAALREAGQQVEIWAARLPPHTTSNVAAAFWYPYRSSPTGAAVKWCIDSYRRFVEIARDPRAGVTMRRARQLSRAVQSRPWWADAVPAVRQATADELPPGFGFGWIFDAPVIDTRRYLPWLVQAVREADVAIHVRRVATLAEPLAHADVVVNCTGLGARELCRDAELYPIRGQLAHVEATLLEDVLLDELDGDGIAYVVPRGDDCVLGGTATDGDDDLQPRPADADGILDRCRRLHPALADARRLADVVGLRPGRSTVRLASETTPDGKRIVHNYGHGGSGFTLSWGCAFEVVEHVLR
jgi:D-amino-acid oxidase